MKKEKAMELFGNYPEMPQRLVDRVIEKGRIKVLVQDGASSEVRCSACGTLSDIPDVKHGQKRRCPACGSSLIVASNRFRWEQNHWRNDENFAVVIPVEGDENAYISVVKVCSYYFQGMMQPAADINEFQRYIFTPRGDAVRYGKTVEWYEDGMRWYRMPGEWKVMSRFAEPVYLGTVSQIYTLLNAEELEGTCLRHCMIKEMMSGGREWNYGIFDYLKFYQKHKGAERLIKIGLNKLVYDEFRKSSGLIDWGQNETHRMLGLTRPEVRKLADGEIRLNERRWIKRVCPGLSPEMYDRLSPAINMGKSKEFEILADDGSITPSEALKYIVRQGAQMGDYIDYIAAIRADAEKAAQEKADKEREAAVKEAVKKADESRIAAVDAARKQEQKKYSDELEKLRTENQRLQSIAEKSAPVADEKEKIRFFLGEIQRSFNAAVEVISAAASEDREKYRAAMRTALERMGGVLDAE